MLNSQTWCFQNCSTQKTKIQNSLESVFSKWRSNFPSSISELIQNVLHLLFCHCARDRSGICVNCTRLDSCASVTGTWPGASTDYIYGPDPSAYECDWAGCTQCDSIDNCTQCNCQSGPAGPPGGWEPPILCDCTKCVDGFHTVEDYSGNQLGTCYNCSLGVAMNEFPLDEDIDNGTVPAGHCQECRACYSRDDFVTPAGTPYARCDCAVCDEGYGIRKSAVEFPTGYTTTCNLCSDFGCPSQCVCRMYAYDTPTPDDPLDFEYVDICKSPDPGVCLPGGWVPPLNAGAGRIGSSSICTPSKQLRKQSRNGSS